MIKNAIFYQSIFSLFFIFNTRLMPKSLEFPYKID